MRVFQKESVAGLFDQTDFDIRQQDQQITRGFGRYQGIEAGKQMQLRAAKALQRGACVQLRQHFKPGHQDPG
ncbi:hypothetical protein D3C76_1122450 [compost metagenome]